MSFPRNALSKAMTLALAGMVGAGFTGAALAASTTSQDAGSTMSQDATGTMSQDATGPSSTYSPSATDHGASDQANRATSPSNAPANRLPTSRGQTGDTSSAIGSQGVTNDTSTPNGMSNPSDLTHGVPANGTSNGMSNPSDLTHGVPSTGTSNGASSSSDLSSGAASSTGNNPAMDSGRGSNANAPVEVYRRQTTIYLVPDHPGSAATSGSTASSAAQPSSGTGSASPTSADQRFDNLVHSDVQNPSSVIGPSGGLRTGDEAATPSSADRNATAPAENNRLPANREDAHPGKGSMQNGGLSGASGTSSGPSTSATGSDTGSSNAATSGSSAGTTAHP